MRSSSDKLQKLKRLRSFGLKSALRPHVPIAPPPAPSAHAPGRFVLAMATTPLDDYDDAAAPSTKSRRRAKRTRGVGSGEESASGDERQVRRKKKKMKKKKTKSSDGGTGDDDNAARKFKKKKKKKKKKKDRGEGSAAAEVPPPAARVRINPFGEATPVTTGGSRGAWVPRSRRVAAAAAAAPTAPSRAATAVNTVVIPAALSRRLKGLFNRLSESNTEPIHGEIAKLYTENANGRAVTTGALTRAVLQICAPADDAAPSLLDVANSGARGVAISEMTAVKFMLQVQVVPTVAAVVAGLHFSVGAHVGAEVARAAFDDYAAALTMRWSAEGAAERRRAEAAGEASVSGAIIGSKRSQNLLLLLVYLYSFGVLTRKLIFDVIRKLIARADGEAGDSGASAGWAEADVEELLVALSHCGFALRRDDPRALGEIVKLIAQKANAAVAATKSTALAHGAGSAALGNRMQYLIDMIVDLKNNRERAKTVQVKDRVLRLSSWLNQVSLTSSSSSSSLFVCVVCLPMTREHIISRRSSYRAQAHAEPIVRYPRHPSSLSLSLSLALALFVVYLVVCW